MGTPIHYEYLGLFGILLSGIFALLIVRGYLTGKIHLFSAWSFFLVGSIEFAAVPCCSLAYGLQEPFGRFNADEVYGLMVGLTLFYLTIIVTYNFANLRGFIGTTMLRWPNLNERSLVVMAIFAMALNSFYVIDLSVPVVSEVLRLIGSKTPAFGTVLLFWAWNRNRGNAFLLKLLIFFVSYSIIFGILAGGGRRTIVSALGAIPIAYYFFECRNSTNRPRTLIRFVAIGLALGFILVVYGGIRHRGRGDGLQRDLGYALNTISMIPQRFFEADGEQLLGQRSIECSMIALRTYRSSPEPLATLRFILTNPIPRSLWPDKPAGLGFTLPKDYKANTRATWGPGVVGHAYHEGSVLFVCLYGLLFGLFLRATDELISRQPDNPFLIATLVAMYPHILGWVRGDIGTFTIQIIGGIVTLMFFRVIGTLYAGGSYRTLPSTDHLTSGQLIGQRY